METLLMDGVTGDAVAEWTLPRVLPPRWSLHTRTHDGARFIVRSLTGGIERSIIVSVATEGDGARWVHVSIARPAKLPTWDDLVEARDVLLGPEAESYQVIPARSRYVNQHPYCLHIFHRLAGPMLPDFTQGGRSL